MTPGRTLPGLKMPGQYGNETVSVLNLKVAKLVPEKHLVLIEGGVPGARNAHRHRPRRGEEEERRQGEGRRS